MLTRKIIQIVVIIIGINSLILEDVNILEFLESDIDNFLIKITTLETNLNNDIVKANSYLDIIEKLKIQNPIEKSRIAKDEYDKMFLNIKQKLANTQLNCQSFDQIINNEQSLINNFDETANSQINAFEIRIQEQDRNLANDVQNLFKNDIASFEGFSNNFINKFDEFFANLPVVDGYYVFKNGVNIKK
jgi:hypothetical protein